MESDQLIIVDDPKLDGTDYAHPAWWRGERYGSEGVIRVVNELLNGKEHTGTYSSPLLETLAQRIIEDRAQTEDMIKALRELLKLADDSGWNFCSDARGIAIMLIEKALGVHNT